MPKFVQIAVIISLVLSVLARRNHYRHAAFQRFLYNLIAVVTTVRKQKFSRNPINQSASLRTIRNGTCCDKKSDRHTIRIHGKMYLGVEPPFVRSIS